MSVGIARKRTRQRFGAGAKRLAGSFSIWRDRIENGLDKMQQRGELSAAADPRELALALLSAVEGGLLLSKTTRSGRPLEIALDMAIDHVARQTTRIQTDTE